MKLLAIDVESGGLYPHRHSLLSVAMVAYDTENPEETPSSMHFYIKHALYHLTAPAMALNKIEIDTLDKNGISPEKAVAEIIKFLTVVGYTDKNSYMCIGKNPAFDRGFLNYLFYKYSSMDIDKHISHRFIDISSLVGLCKDIGEYPVDRSTGLGAVASYYGVDNGLPAHDALGDCFMALNVYEHIKNEILPRYYNG